MLIFNSYFDIIRGYFPMKKCFPWAKLELPGGQLSPQNGIQGAVRPLTSSSRVLVGVHMTNVEKYSATHTKIDKDISRYDMIWAKNPWRHGCQNFSEPLFHLGKPWDILRGCVGIIGEWVLEAFWELDSVQVILPAKKTLSCWCGWPVSLPHFHHFPSPGSKMPNPPN